MKPKTTLYLAGLVFLAIIGCKDKTIPKKDSHTEQHPYPTKERAVPKEPTAEVTLMINNEALSWGALDPQKTSPVTLMDNGLLFRLNDIHGHMVLLNLYAPDFFTKVPLTITQQTAALAPKEVNTVTTQSRLEVVVPSERPVQGDTKVLYEGSVTVEEFSPSKLKVHFQGKGFALGGTKTRLFPMEGTLVLEAFESYDARHHE